MQGVWEWSELVLRGKDGSGARSECHVTQTQVDPKTGALNIKKGEAWINTLTPIITYLLQCNTDVTSFMSGTAIKAIVAYISDYCTILNCSAITCHRPLVYG